MRSSHNDKRQSTTLDYWMSDNYIQRDKGAIGSSGVLEIPLKYPEFEWEHRLDVELIDFKKLGSPDDHYVLKNYIEEKKKVHPNG
ncbi:MAG: hypothetical protein ACI9IZ_001435 [Nonlabens sp.]